MILYVVGIAIALGFAALLWRRRQQKGAGWQREVTFFVDLLALSATALIVGVLAMVQLATPTQPGPGAALVSAPTDATAAPLDGRGSDDFILPEIIDETTPPADGPGDLPPEGTPNATVASNTDSTTNTATPSVWATRESTRTASAEATATSGTTSADTTPTVRATVTPRPTSTPSATATAEATATPEPTATSAPTATPGNRTHTIVAGDTLLEIAAQYGVSTADIIAANPGITADALRVGQQIVIPAPGSAPPLPPPPATRSYTVQAGDTLGAIANRFNTTVAELQRLNPGIDPTRMRVGSVIQVPA